jgi:hypothetical protein
MLEEGWQTAFPFIGIPMYGLYHANPQFPVKSPEHAPYTTDSDPHTQLPVLPPLARRIFTLCDGNHRALVRPNLYAHDHALTVLNVQLMKLFRDDVTSTNLNMQYIDDGGNSFGDKLRHLDTLIPVKEKIEVWQRGPPAQSASELGHTPFSQIYCPFLTPVIYEPTYEELREEGDEGDWNTKSRDLNVWWFNLPKNKGALEHYGKDPATYTGERVVPFPCAATKTVGLSRSDLNKMGQICNNDKKTQTNKTWWELMTQIKKHKNEMMQKEEVKERLQKIIDDQQGAGQRPTLSSLLWNELTTMWLPEMFEKSGYSHLERSFKASHHTVDAIADNTKKIRTVYMLFFVLLPDKYEALTRKASMLVGKHYEAEHVMRFDNLTSLIIETWNFKNFYGSTTRDSPMADLRPFFQKENDFEVFTGKVEWTDNPVKNLLGDWARCTS